MIELSGRIAEFRLAYRSYYTVYKFDELFYLGVRKHYRVEHIVIGDFLCAGLYHDDLLFTCGNGELKRGYISLLCGRVYDRFSVDHTDENSAYRAVPRDIGDRERDRRTYHCSYLR